MDERTDFVVVYDRFLSKIVDDMFMEFTEADTYNILQDLLLSAIVKFEFPKVDLNDYVLGELDKSQMYCGVESNNEPVEAVVWCGGFFNCELSSEEIEILAMNMILEWLNQQLVTTENTRMKYSSNDFHFSSQANHMAKIKELIIEYKEQKINLQRLYCRRKYDEDKHMYISNMHSIMSIGVRHKKRK